MYPCKVLRSHVLLRHGPQAALVAGLDCSPDASDQVSKELARKCSQAEQKLRKKAIYMLP